MATGVRTIVEREPVEREPTWEERLEAARRLDATPWDRRHLRPVHLLARRGQRAVFGMGEPDEGGLGRRLLGLLGLTPVPAAQLVIEREEEMAEDLALGERFPLAGAFVCVRLLRPPGEPYDQPPDERRYQVTVERHAATTPGPSPLYRRTVYFVGGAGPRHLEVMRAAAAAVVALGPFRGLVELTEPARA